MRTTTSFLALFFAFANAANVPVARTVDFEVSSTFNRLVLSTVELRAVSFRGAYKSSGLDTADAEVIGCIPDNLYSWDGDTSTYGCITEETSSVHSAVEVEDRSTSHRSNGVGH
ncbi:hypothetical protein AZE42_12365 [Rhizopogon vesiculosus]|uniref:Uncharacterized protein n=1 Tax=Rhizopogon vesiculosus TaxID=180088 RepID=A0A1J8QPE7_9AGAM|nr:hypothetical protein AZE42_12365 [Rhizopogon vesiculosus]